MPYIWTMRWPLLNFSSEIITGHKMCMIVQCFLPWSFWLLKQCIKWFANLWYIIDLMRFVFFIYPLQLFLLFESICHSINLLCIFPENKFIHSLVSQLPSVMSCIYLVCLHFYILVKYQHFGFLFFFFFCSP